MAATVLCFGNLQLDVLCRTVTALPPPGELQMIDTIDFALSGNGGNVAAALGRLGLEVELAGYSGADIIGEQFRITLAAMGVGTDKLLLGIRLCSSRLQSSCVCRHRSRRLSTHSHACGG